MTLQPVYNPAAHAIEFIEVPDMPTLTDEQVLRERNDLELLKRPHLWPPNLGGFIAVKHRDHERFGICYELHGAFRVRPFIDLGFSLAPPEEIIVFGDAEAVVDAGWLVD